jgi:hypothetical protein
MVKAVDNGELDETRAREILAALIGKLRDNDWDTEYETLENWTHVPWVVKAFADNNVTMVADDELPTRKQLKQAVRGAIDALVTPDSYDLSDDYTRDQYAEAITNAVAAFGVLED